LFVCLFRFPGDWQFIQRFESGASPPAGTRRPEAGSLPGIRSGHVDPPLVLLHAGRPLARLYLVILSFSLSVCLSVFLSFFVIGNGLGFHVAGL